MFFRFNEEGGFNTEDGLFIAALGVFSKVSFESEIDENFIFWASVVLGKDAVLGLDELIWSNAHLKNMNYQVALLDPLVLHSHSSTICYFLLLELPLLFFGWKMVILSLSNSWF